MQQFCHSVRRFLVSEDGPTSVEYCFMIGFILLVVISAIGGVGEVTHGLYKDSYDAMP